MERIYYSVYGFISEYFVLWTYWKSGRTENV